VLHKLGVHSRWEAVAATSVSASRRRRLKALGDR
jgi:hypothetical protein